MGLPRERLENEVLKLPQEERARLVELILRSLESDFPEENQTDVDAAWEAEIERRVSDIKSGRVRPIPGEDVFKELEDLTS